MKGKWGWRWDRENVRDGNEPQSFPLLVKWKNPFLNWTRDQCSHPLPLAINSLTSLSFPSFCDQFYPISLLPLHLISPFSIHLTRILRGNFSPTERADCTLLSSTRVWTLDKRECSSQDRGTLKEMKFSTLKRLFALRALSVRRFYDLKFLSTASN